MPETKYKTRYEKTRIISARALQISQGSPAMVKVPNNVREPIDIARLEWEQGLIPIDIKRQIGEEMKKDIKEDKK
jgi:DNA-directed RNA polymerase subunit K/omega